MEYRQAKKIAVGICYLLQPHCEPERINIAGSVRRKKAEVKDIELVCIAKRVEQPQAGSLFGPAPVPLYVVNKEFERLVKNLGKIESGAPSGKYCKILLPQNIKLDLFMPEPADYFRQYAIRTGSAEYSSRIIAVAWNKKGWCGTTNAGLRRQSDCKKNVYEDPHGKKHTTWICERLDGQLPPVWKSEADFFTWLGVPMLPPENRFFT